VKKVYAAERQLVKVRGVTWLSAAVCIVCLWQGYGLFHTYGLREADGGLLAPLATRAAWGFGVAALGVVFFGGMAWYGSRYVAEVRVDGTSDAVEIDTLRVVGRVTLRVDASAVHPGRYHAGELYTVKHDVKAPWLRLRVDGLDRGLILDAHGMVLDADAFNALLSPKRAKPPARRGT
jgi:hypothetical protein